MGSLTVDVLSVPGTKMSLEGVSGAEVATHVPWPGCISRSENHFLIHAEVQMG